MLDKESPAWVLGFAATIALGCSLIVATTVYWLRPIQAAFSAVEYNRVILAAAGLVEPGIELSDREVVDRFLDLDTRIVDLETQSYTNAVDPLTYDYRAAASVEGRPRYMPVYILELDGQTERIVLPVFGRGMWSTIYGAVTLRGDFRTIAGVLFYEHGETPGIGDRIENPAWLAQWRGKQIFDDAGEVCFNIGGREIGPCNIDGITGATVTVSSIDDMIRDWFGPNGYGPYLRRLAAGELR
jgi:Na+-transporting NADH:ubiquinone oxidoreductase subunit C